MIPRGTLSLEEIDSKLTEIYADCFAGHQKRLAELEEVNCLLRERVKELEKEVENLKQQLEEWKNDSWGEDVKMTNKQLVRFLKQRCVETKEFPNGLIRADYYERALFNDGLIYDRITTYIEHRIVDDRGHIVTSTGAGIPKDPNRDWTLVESDEEEK
jgi:hypothetical protein